MNIIQTIKRQSVRGQNVPTLKGHLAIKLHNPTTGKTEVVEGDNMITNAMRDIFASNYCGVMDYSQMLPLYSKMLGGVLLFHDSLDTSSEGAADDYFIPTESSNSVTAHAGQSTFSEQGDDVKRGNPLSTSMTITDDSVTLAWEWGSSAGNGLISSVALTHSDVGDAGTGANSNAFRALVPFIPSTNNKLLQFRGDRNSGGSRNANFNIPLFVRNNYGYYFYAEANTSTIKLVRFPLAYREAGISANLVKDSSLAETINISTSTTFNEQPFYYYDEDGDKLWLFYNTSISTSVKCEVINLTTMQASNHNFTLELPVGIYSNYIPMPITVYNGYAYFTKMDANNFMCKVKLSSVADITSLTIVGTSKPKIGSCFIPNANNRILAAKNYVINGDTLYECNSSETGARQIGGSGYYYIFPYMESKKGPVCLGGQMHSAQDNYFRAEVSKFYLGTKFNLPSPVTKTTSQSMVVTYTLTEV